MGREPIGLYIFRFVSGFLLLCFLLMLYWSSSLIEKRVSQISREVKGMRREIQELAGRIDKGHGFVLQGDNLTSKEQVSRHIDSSLPNLLAVDPFYESTLPKLLGPQFVPHGELHSAVVMKPSDLHPFNNFATLNDWHAKCGVAVGTRMFGFFEKLSPSMAIKMEKRKRADGLGEEFWVHLRKGVYWQPLQEKFFPDGMELAPWFFEKHPVTAHDFKLYYEAIMNPYVQLSGALAYRTMFSDLEEVEVVDDWTFVVRWKGKEIVEGDPASVRTKYKAAQLTASLRPLASFVYKYFPDGSKISDDEEEEGDRFDPIWAANFSEHWAKSVIVSCGPWMFDGMSDRQIRFVRNPDYFAPLRALVEREVVEFKETPVALWQAFKADRYETYSLRPEQQIEYELFLASEEYQKQKEENEEVNQLDYLQRSYYYIGWNQARPLFKEKKVRQALTMAIDRQRIIQQIMNGMAVQTTGSFFPDSPSYDPTIAPWPYDVDKAKLFLAQEGWYDSNGNGVIAKEIDGVHVPFRFSLTYYVKSVTGKAVCEYIAGALRDVGIDCILHGVDMADLSAEFDGKSFDALFLGWRQSTNPEDPTQLWSSTGAKVKGSSNMIGFANKEADRIIEALDYESDQEKRIALYHRFHRLIHEEQPYTFLFNPKISLLYRERLQNVFIPSKRQDLVPGANVSEPLDAAYYLRKE